MQNIDWQQMLIFQQELHQFSRNMLVHKQKQFLTSSERELLAWLYLEPEKCTPLILSKLSGMKKEAVSRCLKQLYEKNCIQNQKQTSDERSYVISLSETGLKELKKDYEIMLQPFYDLWRSMGEDFEQLFVLISRANEKMQSLSIDE